MTNKKSKIAIAKKNQKALLPVSLHDVQSKIVLVRNQTVISDADIATLYVVETKSTERKKGCSASAQKAN